MARSLSIPPDYAKTLEEIKKRVRAAQYDVLKAVNREQIALYWDIGGILPDSNKRVGAGPWWNGWLQTCGKNSPGSPVSLLQICDACAASS